jgi:exodeoxyribonuclease VII small subunit
VAKETKAPGAQNYAEVVSRLEDVVKRLEAGELSLEDSLKAFEEGIGLVKRGESLLNAAEKKIEQLLEEDGELKEVPLEGEPAERSPSRPPPSAAKDDEDVPF